MIEERLIALVTEALAEAARELGLEGDLPGVELTKPRWAVPAGRSATLRAR